MERCPICPANDSLVARVKAKAILDRSTPMELSLDVQRLRSISLKPRYPQIQEVTSLSPVNGRYVHCFAKICIAKFLLGLFQPFNAEYMWFNDSDTLIIYDHDVTHLNSYLGGAFQQATSCVAQTSESFLDCSVLLLRKQENQTRNVTSTRQGASLYMGSSTNQATAME